MQWREALAKANEQRIRVSIIKKRLKAGEITLREALDHPDAGMIELRKLLESVAKCSRTRALSIINETHISESRRIRDITDRQKDEILQIISERKWYAKGSA